MRCDHVHCALNDELLLLLPLLECEQQQAILKQWPTLGVTRRRETLRLLRPLLDVTIEPDFAALAKLADFFDCAVFDMVRYVRDE